MKKIISLFQRNYDGDRLVRNEIVPGAEWVVSGEGIATRKWDGTSCLIKDGKLYKRYDVKKGRVEPIGFIPAQDPDPVTGHWPGWVEVSKDKPEDQWHREALDNFINGRERHSPESIARHLKDGVFDFTYELCGPKIQGNPEHFESHRLVPHTVQTLVDAPRDFDNLKEYFSTHDIEGIVWWRDLGDQDCDKVKIKAKDFGIKRQKTTEREE